MRNLVVKLTANTSQSSYRDGEPANLLQNIGETLSKSAHLKHSINLLTQKLQGYPGVVDSFVTISEDQDHDDMLGGQFFFSSNEKGISPQLIESLEQYNDLTQGRILSPASLPLSSDGNPPGTHTLQKNRPGTVSHYQP